MRKLLGNLLVLSVSLLVVFTAAELLVRSLYREESVLFPRYHTDYHYGRYTLRGIRASADFWHTSADGSWEFVTNKRGFRDRRDFSYAKPAGMLRILSLGDSHTQGYEVRQDFTFTAVAERYLAARGVKAQGINAGVSGFSNAEELAFLENEGYRYQPDVVVLGFFGNDFEDNLKAGLFALDGERGLREVKYEHIPGVKIQNVIYAVPPVRWLSENSYLYSLLFNGVWEYFKARLAKQATAEFAVPKQAGPAPQEVALAAALIERMQRFCAAHGARFIVVDIPLRTGPEAIASSLPQALKERLAREGIEVIASDELLGRFAGGPQMHVPHGHQHISEFTHSLIGVEIAQRVLAGVKPRAASPMP
jgi:hypothetical protein